MSIYRMSYLLLVTPSTTVSGSFVASAWPNKGSFRYAVHYWKFSQWLLSINSLSKLRIGKKIPLTLHGLEGCNGKKKCGSGGYIS